MRSIIVIFVLLFSVTYTQAQDIDLDMVPYLSGFSNPVDIANADDGSNRMFVVERSGIIRVVEEDTIREVDFIDISNRVSSGGERGLLGLAFHPDYENNGYFYVNYTRSAGSLATRISRFSISEDDPNQADPDSELILLEFEQPFGNHNGGDLNFGPNDGYLYIATGDGGAGGDPGDRSQDAQDFLGKLLRIDVDNGDPYAIPDSNPFAGSADTLPEIWSLGLRNPWRFSFDRLNGNMWIADVGQGEREELNFEPANSVGGYNWGWRCYEGNLNFNLQDCSDFEGYDGPIIDYTHDNNGVDAYGVSVTGGYVYRGGKYPDMQGWYFMADYVTNHFWAVKYDGIDTTVLEYRTIGDENNLFGISTFGEAENGDLYAALLGSGTLYEMVDLTVVDTKEPLSSAEPMVNVFPNPTDGRVNLNCELQKADDVQIVIYNSLGATILQDQLKNSKNFTRQYDLSEYPSGIYLIEVASGQGQITTKQFLVE